VSLSPSEWIVFSLLHKRFGHSIRFSTILDALGASRDDPPGPDVLYAFVCKINRKLTSFGYRIIGRRWDGYTLTRVSAAADPEIVL